MHCRLVIAARCFSFALLNGLLCTSVLLTSEQKPAAPASPVVFTNVAVIDGTGTPIQSDRTVVIIGDSITAIGPVGKVRAPKGARVVNARGKFLIPGLWDMHAHLTGFGRATHDEAVLQMWAKEVALPLFVANGVCGVRDMGSEWELLRPWRQQIDSGALLGPRIVAAGPILDGPTPGYPLRITVRNAAEAREAVATVKKDGVDFIKVHAHLSRESYFAIAEEAKKQGLPFAGHIPRSVAAAEASNAGQKSIEHLNESHLLIDCSRREAELRPKGGWWQESLESFDEQKCQKLFERFRRNNTWQDPTLTTLRVFSYLDEEDPSADPTAKYVPKHMKVLWEQFKDMFFKNRTKEEWALAKKVYEKDLSLVGAMRRAGVRILAGTDRTSGFSLHEELELLVRAGLTPLEALQAATRNPAEYLGRLNSLGTIEVGKSADLVLLQANPLEDIRNTQKIEAVVLRGRLMPRTELDSLLARAEAAARAEPTPSVQRAPTKPNH